MKKTFIIAEIGVNHNGSMELAKKMVRSCKEARVDAVKFQTFKASMIATQNAPKAEYQDRTTEKAESQFDMLKRLELNLEQHEELKKDCDELGLIFLSSPFDIPSISLLESFGLETFKIPSGEAVNLPFLRAIGKLNKKVILSTGMCTLDEISKALDILEKAGTPKENITLLHCNTEYPTPYSDVNLLAMNTLKKEFQVEVGYSDHTLGIEVPIAAVSLGATVIEKHVTLDKNMDGPDHAASIEMDELSQMVRSIRNIETALGTEEKRPSPSELRNREIVRKSIVASRIIKKGEVLSEENLGVKRPGQGISPMMWDQVVGSKAKKDYFPDEQI